MPDGLHLRAEHSSWKEDRENAEIYNLRISRAMTLDGKADDIDDVRLADVSADLNKAMDELLEKHATVERLTQWRCC